ncbi:MAG: transposase [Sandaracinaceae bacterium]|nr:transposase [Sandaracinaceae bacterium]
MQPLLRLTQHAAPFADKRPDMARRRHFAPDQDLVHVSFKCVGDAFLMRPDAYTSFVIASALEQAAEKYGVRIHAFCFVSNHAHLLVGIQGCRLDSFMQYLKSLIALALNLHRERDGAFFKRRYRAEPILSVEAAVGIEQYVHQQAVKHELVERAVEWPGLCSYRAVIEGRASVEASWFDDERWREAGASRRDRARFVRMASVPLTPLPHRVGLTDRELRAQRRALEENMKDVEAAVARERRDEGARRLPKPSSYTTQDPNGLPARRREQKTPQPYAHGSDAQVQAYEQAYAEVMAAYDIASERYRETGVLCPFPAGTFPPRIPTPREVL